MLRGLTIIFSLFFLKLIITEELSIEPKKRITVGFFKREPFIYTNNIGKLMGLDVVIMENFARKFNFELKYIEHNISLNEISNNREIFADYMQQSHLK